MATGALEEPVKTIAHYTLKLEEQETLWASEVATLVVRGLPRGTATALAVDADQIAC